MQEKKQKMAFYQVGQGRMAMEMQTAFEEAQRMAKEFKMRISIGCKIVIDPPDPKDPHFGTISFAVKKANPEFKSRAYTTELDDGDIIDDGYDVASILQTNFRDQLEFKVNKTA